MQHSDVRASRATDADRRALETEQQMTDDERFSLLGSVMGPMRWSRSGTSGFPPTCR
jgi:hypothetical protein